MGFYRIPRRFVGCSTGTQHTRFHRGRSGCTKHTRQYTNNNDVTTQESTTLMPSSRRRCPHNPAPIHSLPCAGGARRRVQPTTTAVWFPLATCPSMLAAASQPQGLAGCGSLLRASVPIVESGTAGDGTRGRTCWSFVVRSETVRLCGWELRA